MFLTIEQCQSPAFETATALAGTQSEGTGLNLTKRWEQSHTGGEIRKGPTNSARAWGEINFGKRFLAYRRATRMTFRPKLARNFRSNENSCPRQDSRGP